MIENQFVLNVNASYQKRENLVFINKFVSEQNGTVLQEFSPLLRRISDNIMVEIQFYVRESATVLKKYCEKISRPSQQLMLY